MAKIFVLHGPNLNLLGSREPDVYGSQTLSRVNQHLIEMGKQLGHTVSHLQSNAEHELIASIHRAVSEGIDFIIINPAAFTHTSVALRDALLGVNLPFIEVHISNTYSRESFRHTSYLSDVAVGVIVGLGTMGYDLALQAADRFLKEQQSIVDEKAKQTKPSLH